MINVNTPQCDKAKWTVLLYSAADNNLTPWMVDDVKEIESVGSDSYTKLVAQVDQGGDIGAARYLLEKGEGGPGQIASPVLESMGDINMSDPNTLADFIKWGVQNYPAEHYMVIMSDHGDGWNGAMQDVGSGGWMTSGMIREGFEKAQAETGVKIDVLGLDACLMASSEFAHEMKDVASYLVASEQVEGADGWNYSQILNPQLLKNLQTMQMMKIDVEPRQLAELGVTSAESVQETLPTMTAVDLSMASGVTAAVNELGQAILASSTPGETFRTIAGDTENFYGYKDLGDFAARIVENTDIDGTVKEAATKVIDAMTAAIVAEQHSADYPGATGLTIEIPTWGGVPSGYTDLKFDQDSQWSQALAKITEGGSQKV